MAVRGLKVAAVVAGLGVESFWIRVSVIRHVDCNFFRGVIRLLSRIATLNHDPEIRNPNS